MKDFNATPLSDANAKASQAGVILQDRPQSRPKPRTAQPVNDSLPLQTNGTVELPFVSRFAHKR